MLFNVLLAAAAAAPAVLAAPNLAARDAPEVTYPHSYTVWQPNHRHNVTWAATSGTGSIQMKQGDKTTTLANNVDLSRGRTEINVPGNVAAGNDYAIEIVAGGETATGPNFAIATSPAQATSIAASASSAFSSEISSLSSATGAAGSAASSAASAGSSIVASASSVASSVVASVSSTASAAASSVESVTSSAGESASSAASSLESSASSVAASLSSAVSAGHSSVSNAVSSLISSATAPASSSASSSPNAAMRADFGISATGIALAAGLVAISTVSGALLF